VASFWEKLGLEDNPYDPKPLGISKDNKKLFVGRDRELKQLKTITSGGSGGICIIEGEIGVGKTSFVNIFQLSKFEKDNFLPAFESIELAENTDATNFLLSLLSSMISNLEQVVESKLLMKYEEYKKAKAFVDSTIESGWGISAQAVIGGGISKSKTRIQPPTVVLQTIKKTIDEWVEFVNEKVGYSSIIVTLDNFDIISEESITGFLNSMRDTLISRNNIWWIIIGQKGLSSILAKEIPRVSGMITGKSIIINALTVDEVNNMIDLRYKNLKLSKKKVELIIPREVINVLYDVTKGDTRDILKKTTDMIYSFIGDYPSQKTIPEKVAKKMLYDDSKNKIESAKLTKLQLEKLEKMVKIGTFQPSDFKKLELESSQAVNKYVRKFTPLGFLIKNETAGKEVYYRTTGDVNIYFDKTFTNL